MKHPAFPLVNAEKVSEHLSIQFGKHLHPMFVWDCWHFLEKVMHRASPDDMFFKKRGANWILHTVKDTLYHGPEWDRMVEAAKKFAVVRPNIMRGRTWDELHAELIAAKPRIEAEDTE